MSEMLFFMVDSDHFVVTDASEETLRELWNAYHMYRYDINFTFYTFLRENGVCFRVASTDLTFFGLKVSTIEISLN
ncbi:MAG: hypothetical protein ABR903_00020 [Thermodesulfovibrionales bacterium]|jgi:hypothetical protein